MSDDGTTIQTAKGSLADATTLPGSAAAPLSPAQVSSSDEYPQPTTIGRYRIIRLLGEGGMGVVYEAEQDQPRRRVALKVIKAAWASPELLRRFEQESQALGRLNHPGIAQVYEAGSAESGSGFQPFFAMELIQGKPLVEYADRHKLNTQQRLELMIQVCDAVHHAHQRGIIHRDLKPGNILVDESGQPKILDFGLARATDSDAQATRQTDIGQLLGTLAYMSPEQVLADPMALDTRSDVYALGVLLYELLAGKMPYTLSRQLHEAVRTIQQTDPAPLSSVSKLYRGDIETIAAKALEKDKARRYASAAELAADIGRYLRDEPIVARPASASYQLKKFARRHKALVAAVAAVFVILVLGIVASTWEAVLARRAESAAAAAERQATSQRDRAIAAESKATQERDRAVSAETQARRDRNAAIEQKHRADSETASANAVNDFLENDLLAQAGAAAQSGPTVRPDPDLKVRTALDRAAERIQGKFEKQPDVEAAIRQTAGQTYRELGIYPESRKQLERALELRRRVLGPDSPKTIETMLSLAQTAKGQDKTEEAEKLDTQALNISRRALGPDNPVTLKSMSDLSGVYLFERKPDKAEPLATQAVEAMRRVRGPENRDTLSAMTILGSIYARQGKYAQSEQLYTGMLEISRRVLGSGHPTTLMAMIGLGNADFFLGKYAQADTLYSGVLEVERQALGAENPDTLTGMYLLTAAYLREGKGAQAEALSSEALAIKRRTLGPGDRRTLNSMEQLGSANELEGKYAQAEELLSQLVEGRRKVQGPSDPDTVRAISDLAGAYEYEGKYANSEQMYREALEASPKDPWCLYALAEFLLTVPDRRLRNPVEALEYARRAAQSQMELAVYLNTLGLAEVQNSLWGDAIATLHKSVQLHGGSDPTDFLYLARAYHGDKDEADAERNFERGVDLAGKSPADDWGLRMAWAEAAQALNKPGPVPTLVEVKAQPDLAMERLKQMAASGFLKPETVETSADLAPLRGRADFQQLLKEVGAAAKISAR